MTIEKKNFFSALCLLCLSFIFNARAESVNANTTLEQDATCSFTRANNIYELFIQFYNNLDKTCLETISSKSLQDSLGIQVVDKRSKNTLLFPFKSQSSFSDNVKIERFKYRYKIIANETYLKKHVSIFPNNVFPDSIYPHVAPPMVTQNHNSLRPYKEYLWFNKQSKMLLKMFISMYINTPSTLDVNMLSPLSKKLQQPANTNNPLFKYENGD